MTMFEAPAFAFLGALICNLVGTPVVIHLLKKYSVLDIPNERSSHETPIPRGGGIVIVATWCFGMVMTWAIRFPLPELGILGPNGFVVSMTIGMVALACLGFIDDRRDLKPLLKLVVQIAVAAQALWLSGLELTDFCLPYLPDFHLGPWSHLVGMIWLVGLTNIFNFMDGINGLAFTQLIFGGTTFCLIGILNGDYELAISGALVAGSAVGILKYNFPKALVFMGDVGSLPLGFLLAFMGLRVAFGPSSENMTFLQPVLVLWPFLYDGGFTLLNRLYHGRNPFRSHRSHLYQRLVISGESHMTITLRYGTAMFGCAVAGLFLPWLGEGARGAIMVVVLVASVVFTVIIVRRVDAGMTLGDGAEE
ncbi:MAG: glycosyltransferase family 4 protein [Gemmatimonadales bacterium]|nr:glycosyltransferase family 4 protein [Gemmatimonadales bacterium]